MGSPTAPLMADVFMDTLESDIFSSSHPVSKFAHYWYRYVHDVLCLWTGSTGELNHFLTFINSLYPTIQFTLEIGGQKINFLDLTIELQNGRHCFDIFPKPTHTDTLISGSSYHPVAHKHAAFLSMIHRLLSVPLSTTNFRNEVSTIKYLAKTNNINLDIDSLIRRKSAPPLFLTVPPLTRETPPLRNGPNYPSWAACPKKYLVFLVLAAFGLPSTLPAEYFSALERPRSPPSQERNSRLAVLRLPYHLQWPDGP